MRAKMLAAALMLLMPSLYGCATQPDAMPHSCARPVIPPLPDQAKLRPLPEACRTASGSLDCSAALSESLLRVRELLGTLESPLLPAPESTN